MPGTSKWNKVELSLSSGNSGAGEFARTLNVTDIHTAWTESRAVLGRGQAGVERALNNEVEKTLPFRLLGLDSDNGSEFINWHLKAWRERKQIQPTRGRPYKNTPRTSICGLSAPGLSPRAGFADCGLIAFAPPLRGTTSGRRIQKLKQAR